MRPLMFAIFAVLAAAIFTTSAEARVYSLRPTQDFFFENPNGTFGPPKVAIDGDSAIALMDTAGGREALLFQRDATGRWSQIRTLFSVPTSSQLRNELAMDNNKAAIMLDSVLRIFERNSSNQWTESATAGTPQPAGGIAISGGRILVGKRGCNYDADVHEKSNGSGVWRVAGRIHGAVGVCNDHGAALDINGSTAMVRNPNSEVRIYRYAGAIEWPQVASFIPPPGVTLGFGPMALIDHTAFADEGAVFHDDFNDDWRHVGYLRPLDYANGTGAGSPDARANVVLTHAAEADMHADAHVYVYTPTTPTQDDYEHAAVLYTPAYVSSSDVSGSTVIAGSLEEFSSSRFISFFTLPSPVRAPQAYANDFTTHDPATWQQTPGSQFARVASGSNFVYRQSSLAGEAQAVHIASDWPVQQSIEADITPTAINGTDRWVGLAARYTDVNNHYYVTLRSSNRIQLRRKVAGAYVTLADAALPFTLNARYHVKLIVNRFMDSNSLSVYVDGTQRLGALDNMLTHGNVALLTYRARADFDNVYASPTAPFNLTFRDFHDIPLARPFTQQGGHWDFSEIPGSGELAGWAQFDTSGDARAFIGTPTDDQSINARVRLDVFNSSPAGAWFGLLARYVNAGTHYYLTVRSANRLEIRKQVNGTPTVLASVPFTPTPGQFYNLKFTVLSDELHAYVDGVLLAQAQDGQIARGQYGMATYRAAATYQNFIVEQP